MRQLVALPANQARTRLWLDEQGGVAGYGMVDHFDNILFDAVADGNTGRRYSEILAWAEQAVAAGRKSAGPVTLEAACRSEDRPRIQALHETGFRPSGLSTLT